MISERELIASTGRLEIHVLHEWIEMGLVAPKRSENGYVFDDIDAARVYLACDLCFDMGLGHEPLLVILSLLDQLHSARHSLRAFASAVANEPDEIQDRIKAHVHRALGGSGPG